MIVIVNCGVGNLDSVVRAFRYCEADAVVSSRGEDVERADGIVLPGVGFFGEAMQNLKTVGLLPVLNHKVLEQRVPTLGICLGFQMLTQHSEEGDAAGLGWIDGETRRFDFAGREDWCKVPHMGWDTLNARKESPLLAGIHPDACFYFAHSYCVFCRDEGAILSTTTYGYEFVSAIQRDNIFGTQFHPEKSHANGLRLIRNFLGCVQHG